MMDGCIHNNWSLPSSTWICWILAEMVTLAEFGDLASAIPIRDIWKQKHHKAIRDMWIPFPLVNVISTKDHALQGYSSIVTCATTDGQLIHVQTFGSGEQSTFLVKHQGQAYKWPIEPKSPHIF
ncbi:hypothetical protein ACB094_11G170000 [Castanea mollissima]